MEKYILSDNFEINYIDNTSIIYSNDFKGIFQCGVLETEIIQSFVAPIMMESVEEKFSKYDNFSKEEFDMFSKALLLNQIIKNVENSEKE